MTYNYFDSVGLVVLIMTDPSVTLTRSRLRSATKLQTQLRYQLHSQLPDAETSEALTVIVFPPPTGCI